MKIKKKLVLTYLGVGLVPVIGMGVVTWMIASKGVTKVSSEGEAALEKSSYERLEALRDVKADTVQGYFHERAEDVNFLVDSVSVLREEAIKKLTAVRENKSAAVQRYFKLIEDQVLTFSEDRMVVDAARRFCNTFSDASSIRRWGKADVAKMKGRVGEYYGDQFDKKYKNETGETSDPAKLVEQLDREAIVLQDLYIARNVHPLGEKQLLDRAGDVSEYSKVHAGVHPIIRSYLEKFGYYDIFIVDSDSGDIVYSVFKELDYATSLNDGPYSKTNLARAFQQANSAAENDAVVAVDFERYTPSYEAPAGFIASPVFDGDEKVAVVIFQMPIANLNEIMAERAGLGDSGETYLVGPDKLMRSDSFLDPSHRTVRASFANPSVGTVDTVASRAALSGETGSRVVRDYNGNLVLSAYTSIPFGENNWGLLAEIDIAEAFCPKDSDGTYLFENFTQNKGYYDLFLLNPDGYCFYTVAQEADYQTNLISGKYASSGLGQAVQAALAEKKLAFADYAPYEPSAGAPASFLAQPVLFEGEPEIVVAVQLSDEKLNQMMATGSNRARGQESYLVGQDGFMRSDSVLHPAQYSIRSSFQLGNRVSTVATQSAANGESKSEVIVDSSGNRVLSAWRPIDVLGSTWTLISEVDESMAMAGARQLSKGGAESTSSLMSSVLMSVLVCILIVAAGVGTFAILFARSMSKPIVLLSETMADVAEGGGDLTAHLEAESKDEIGDTAASFNLFLKKMREIIANVKANAFAVASSSHELSDTATLAEWIGGDDLCAVHVSRRGSGGDVVEHGEHGNFDDRYVYECAYCCVGD